MYVTVRQFEIEHPDATTDEKLAWMGEHLRSLRLASTLRLQRAASAERIEKQAQEAVARIQERNNAR